MSRIDCFFISKEGEKHFDDVIQTVMPRGLLDHIIIKLNSKGVNWGPRPL